MTFLTATAAVNWSIRLVPLTGVDSRRGGVNWDLKATEKKETEVFGGPYLFRRVSFSVYVEKRN